MTTPKVHRPSGTQGGDKLIVESGGEIEVKSGGKVQAAVGSGIVPGVIAHLSGGAPILYFFEIPDTADDYDITIANKIRVIDAWGVNIAAGHVTADTWQVKNGNNAITDAVKKTDVNNAITRAATIDTTKHEVAANGTLRVTAAKTTNCAVSVYVLAIRV